MKKHIYTFCLLCLGTIASVWAQVPTNPQFQWVASQSGNESREIYEDIAPAADGNFFTASDFKSAAPQTTDYFTYDVNGTALSEATYKGALGKDNEGTMNAIFSKIDPEGHLIWGVHTNAGDHNGLSIAPMPDGGAVVAMKLRENKKVDGDIFCSLVDVNSQENVIHFANPNPDKYKRIYAPVLARFSTDGEVLWIKRYDVNLDTSVFPAMKDGIPLGGTDFVDVRDIATDAAGNAYILGTHRASIDFGNQVVLPLARNIVDYDGRDGGEGDLFIAKFNAEGIAQWAMHTAGDPLGREAGLGIAVEGESLYFIASVEGTGTGALQLGGFSCIPPTHRSLLMGCLSTVDASVQWAQFYASDKSIKPMHVNLGADKVYFSGSVMGNMIDGSTTVLSAGKDCYHAFILALDKTAGALQAAWVNPEEGISEVQSVFEYGKFVWANAYNMNKGQMYLHFEADLNKGYTHYVKTQNTNEITSAGLLLGDQFISAARFKRPAQLIGCNYPIVSVHQPGKEQFACLLYSYQLPLAPAVGVEELTAENDLQVIAGKGEVILLATQSVPVRIYDLLGKCVYSTRLEGGSLSVALPQGIYIVNHVKTMVY